VFVYEGVHHIIHPEPVKNPLINYIVLGLAMIFEGFAWGFALKEFKKFKGKKGYLEAIHSPLIKSKALALARRNGTSGP